MDDGEQDVHERGRGDDSVQKSEERAEEPAFRADRGEQREVDKREDLAGGQVHEIPECLGARAITGDGGPEEERQVDAREAELVCRPQARRKHERALLAAFRLAR